MYSIFSYSYLSYTYFFLHLLLFLQLWRSPFMWEGAVNECGWARGKCVGFHHSFLSEWQKPDKALEAGLRVQKREKKKKTRNSFFPDGHCKTEQNMLCKFVEAAPAWITISHSEENYSFLMENGLFICDKKKKPLTGSSLVCWVCNGPRCWSQCSICVCTSDKYKREKFLSSYQAWGMKRRE